MEKNNHLSALLSSSVISFIYFVIINNLAYDGHNVVVYAGAIVMFFLTYAIAIYVGSKFKINTLLSTVIAAGYFFAGAYWLIRAYFEELYDRGFAFPTRLIRHRLPAPVYVLAMFAVIVMLCILSQRSMGFSKSRIYRTSISMFFIYIETMLLFTRNTFGEYSMEMFHINAYINSIFNVQSLTPYSMASTSIYGHYGLIYFIPVAILRLLGTNKWIAIVGAITFFGCIAYIAQTLLLNFLLENDLFFTLALICNAVMHIERNDGVYYQITPHRVLFPSLVLLFCYLYSNIKSKEKFFEVALWLLASMSVIWNFETGLVCTGIILIMTSYQACKRIQKYKISTIAVRVGYAILSFTLAYVVVNVYNLIVGGTWNDILEFIYPSGSLLRSLGFLEASAPVIENIQTVASVTDTAVAATTEYDIKSILQTTIGTPFEGYWLYIILMCGYICSKFFEAFKFKISNKDLSVLLTSFMGLGIFSYYMNRSTSSNLQIIVYEFTLVFIYVLESNAEYTPANTYQVKANPVRCITYLFGIVIASSLCISTLGDLGGRLERYMKHYYANENLEEYLWQFRDVINEFPEGDRVAIIGNDASTVAALLDTNTYVHIMDFEDMTDEGLARMHDIIEENQFPYIISIKMLDNQKAYIPEQYVVDHEFLKDIYLLKRSE